LEPFPDLRQLVFLEVKLLLHVCEFHPDHIEVVFFLLEFDLDRCLLLSFLHKLLFGLFQLLLLGLGNFKSLVAHDHLLFHRLKLLNQLLLLVLRLFLLLLLLHELVDKSLFLLLLEISLVFDHLALTLSLEAQLLLLAC